MSRNGKLIIVSTRLPVSVSKVNGKLKFKPSVGGLATGVSKVSETRNSIWVGWPGISSDELTKKDKIEIVKELKKHKCHPVFLNSEEVDNFYSGYSNATLWPLFHYFIGRTKFDPGYWDMYKTVNKQFRKEVDKFMTFGDQVWVHDYQLMLLPGMLRQKTPDALIGFFLHIPFPSYEIFRLLPEREEILRGLMGASLVGFHTYDYVRHFLSSVHRILGYENNLGQLQIDDRVVQADAFPIGIDYDKFAKNSRKRSVKNLIKTFDIFDKNKKIILSVDRADYSKGIPARLDAIERFLDTNPDVIGEVAVVMLAIPSREDVESYQILREEIEQKVSRINGKFSTVNWTPIIYRYRSLPFDELTALYAMADVMLVTPHRDGMNLVAKEYVAAHHKRDGVLILSELAGVASELPEALKVNPNDYQRVADTIVQALDMSKREQKQRMKSMQDRISSYTITKWAEDFIYELSETEEKLSSMPNTLSGAKRNAVIAEYKKAKKRLILLDYDGTLKSFVSSPDKSLAHPTTRVRWLIRRMTSDPKNKVVIVSGRPKSVLESFFENKGLGLVAEHGGWIFDAGFWAKSNVTSKKWKKDIIPILQQYATRTPGATMEEKDFSLVWHYRNVTPDLAYVRKEELKNDLYNILGDGEISVYEGKKVIEIKPKNMHKGAIVSELLLEESWDFILCMGDDYTDEDMFRALPEMANTIHVGVNETEAHYRVPNVKAVIELLNDLR